MASARPRAGRNHRHRHRAGFPKKSPGRLSGRQFRGLTVAASGYFTADVVIPPTSQQVLDIQAVSGTVKASAAFTVAAATPVTSPPAISSAPLRLGVGTTGGPLASAELDQAASLAGEAPPVILSYEDFNQAPPELRRLAPGKQVLVAETSSAEQGGSKADWNTALISYLASQTDVTTVVWFDFNK